MQARHERGENLIFSLALLLHPRFMAKRLNNFLRCTTISGRRKCREEWPSVGTERAYNLFLDGTLLLIPLVVMSLAYSLIAKKLWRGLKLEIRQSSTCTKRRKWSVASIYRAGDSANSHVLKLRWASHAKSSEKYFPRSCRQSQFIFRRFSKSSPFLSLNENFISFTQQCGKTSQNAYWRNCASRIIITSPKIFCVLLLIYRFTLQTRRWAQQYRQN